MSLKTYLLRCKRENAKLLFWLLLNSLCVLANGLLSAQALTSLVAQDTSAFLYYISLNLVVYLIWMIQIRQIAPARERALQAMNHEMRTDILKGLRQMDYDEFHRESADTYTSWLTNDMTTINDLGFETLELMLTQALNVIFSAVTLVSYHPSFALSVLILTGLMSALPKLFEQQLADKALLFSQNNEKLLASINHTLKGHGVLFGAGRLSELTRRIAQPEADYARSRVAYQQNLGAMMATQNGLSFLSQLTILAQAGVLFALGLVPIGTVSSSPYFASVTFAGLTGFFANWSEVKSISPILDKWRQVTFRGNSRAEQLVFERAVSLTPTRLHLSEQVTLDFPAMRLIKGGRYRLTGPSGIGKSSLLHLLAGRLKQQTGDLRIDDKLVTNSRQLQTIISLVAQDSFIFEDSLRYNLTLGRTIDDQLIQEWLHQFALTDLLEQLPAGLDSTISQDSLSGGQAQRICLLRAVLEDKPLLLLDEATAAIDPDTVEKIEKLLFNLPDKTIIFTSHQAPIDDPRWTTISLA